jgi:phenylpyruvate tautomerase PptA (4-oxalocrotonate tautomerase family)
MPLVRIDIPAATSADDQTALADAVHGALVATFNVPLPDRFQTINRRTPGTMICSDEFLGIRHTDQVVFIEINCSFGRSVDMKKNFYARTAADIAATTSFKAEDVIINLIKTARENWSFGNGLAQYAQ